MAGLVFGVGVPFASYIVLSRRNVEDGRRETSAQCWPRAWSGGWGCRHVVNAQPHDRDRLRRPGRSRGAQWSAAPSDPACPAGHAGRLRAATRDAALRCTSVADHRPTHGSGWCGTGSYYSITLPEATSWTGAASPTSPHAWTTTARTTAAATRASLVVATRRLGRRLGLICNADKPIRTNTMPSFMAVLLDPGRAAPRSRGGHAPLNRLASRPAAALTPPRCG